jgi:DNA-3-methyladenine glycosylase I
MCSIAQMITATDRDRCKWCLGHPVMIEYHDTEWGVPVHDDRKLFEFLVLDAAQAGLSWRTILLRRDGYRRSFANFDPQKVARYGAQDTKRLLNDTAIIRNKLKVRSAIINAQKLLDVQGKFGSFDHYVWQFVGGQPRIHRCKTMKQMPATSKESDTMSKDMKARGFAFVGSTICYAFMQAAGLVNDHVITCFRHSEVQR